MIPFRRKRGPANDQQGKAVENALKRAYDAAEQEQNKELERLIERMRDFEGSSGGEK